MEDLQLKIALSIIPKIGPVLVRRLVAYTGGIEAVFKEKKQTLSKIPGIGESKSSLIDFKTLLTEAEKEIQLIEKEGITPYFYLDKNYPLRLKECEDAPIIFYSKGFTDFNVSKVISIVGTRNATEYGKSCTEEIVAYLGECFPDILIVSGLAYGIDIAAHKSALKNNLKTLAILGHGLSFLYPALHSRYARKIENQGALISEFRYHQKPEPGNFVSRNRIIAGLADATLVIESAEKGGALITADMANSYNREVFAVPGRNNDLFSKGCNNLIKLNKAALIENGSDLELAMGWHKERKKPDTIQKSLFIPVSSEEEKILALLTGQDGIALDFISRSLEIPVSKVSANLLNLEFNGLVRSMPGKLYART
jgi:DNA processing protein